MNILPKAWIPALALLALVAGCCPDCPDAPGGEDTVTAVSPVEPEGSADCWDDYTCEVEEDQGRNVHRAILWEQDGKTMLSCASNPDKPAYPMLVCRNDLVLLRNDLGVEVVFEVPGDDPLFWWDNSDGSTGKLLPPGAWVALRVRPDAVTVEDKVGGHRFQITVKPFTVDPEPVIKVKK